MGALLLAALLLAQQKEPTSEQKQIAALVSQIRRLAASEPVVYGVDTRLRTAAVLTQKYPKVAKDLLREAQSALGGVRPAAEQDAQRVRVVELMAPLDLAEAEHLIGAIRRGGEEDYVAQAYDGLVEYCGNTHCDAREMISKGLQAGGFRSASAAKMLEDSKTANPAAAASLFGEILGSFPSQSFNDKDLYYLLDRTRLIVGLNRPLAVEAIDKSLSAALSETLDIPLAARQKMLREIASLIGSIDPELLERYKTERKQLADATLPENIPPPEKDEKQNLTQPDWSALSYSDALSQAGKLQDPGERVAALISIYRRETITAQQRDSVASEALTSANLMPISGDRLVAMAMISRDFARNGELGNAAFAAELLSETYGKACDCDRAMCKHSGETFECLELVQSFAEYLDEFKITPESMNLTNISLEARLSILKLYPLLGLKAPSMFF